METTSHIPKFIAGAGILFFLYVVINTATPKVPGANSQYIDEGDNSPIDEAKDIATTLHEAMKSSQWRTDDEKIEVIMTAVASLSIAQFGQVFKAFGSRGYNTVLGNDQSVWGYDLKKYNLKSWLKMELKPLVYNQLRNKFKKYL